MQIYGNLILRAAVLGLCGELSGAAETPYVQHENIVYGEIHGIGLLMDVFTPQGNSNGLGVIDVISGAWHSDRSKIHDHERAQTFDILCRKGYTVFAIRPGSVTKFSVAEMLDNLKLGIRWVKIHADEYKIDPDRLGLMELRPAAISRVWRPLRRTQYRIPTTRALESDASVKAVAVFFPATDFLDYGGKLTDARADDDRGKLILRICISTRCAKPDRCGSHSAPHTDFARSAGDTAIPAIPSYPWRCRYACAVAAIGADAGGAANKLVFRRN